MHVPGTHTGHRPDPRWAAAGMTTPAASCNLVRLKACWQRSRLGRGVGGACFRLQHDSHDHIQSPTRPARPVTRLATGERGEGKGGQEGRHDNDLVTRGQHDRIQSRPQPARPVTRLATGERRERGGGRGGGMVTTLFHAASMTTARHDHIQSPTR